MPLPLSPARLKDVFLSLGLTDEAGWTDVIEDAERRGIDLEAALIDREIVTDENFGKVVSDAIGVPFVHLTTVGISPDARALVTEAVARAQELMPFLMDAETVKVAMHDPKNRAAIRAIEKKSGRKAIAHFATARDIEGALAGYQRGIKETFAELIDQNVTAAGSSYRAEDLPITRIVDALMQHGFESGASDIHIEPQDKSTVIRYRIDGVLKDVITIPKRVHELLVARVKILAKLKTDEHRSAQDGKFQYVSDGNRTDVRVSIAPIIEGEKVVMRLLSEKTRRYALEELGLRGPDLARVHAALEKPWGLILATGPTGCGKTTTLYAMLKVLNERQVNIATIEDPVEYEIPGVNQIQVSAETNLTFAEGLKSVVRQDPDIIMVGEVRDAETGAIGVNAAMTGHLVLSTLHSNDAATTIPRLLDLKIEPFLLSSTLNIVIAQRLVRRNCRSCLASYESPVAAIAAKLPKAIVAKYFTDKRTVRLFKGKGCAICHGTGQIGRIGIYEVMEATEAIRKLVTSRATADEIRLQAIADGMTTMFEDGLEKVLAGETSIDEVLKETRA